MSDRSTWRWLASGEVIARDIAAGQRPHRGRDLAVTQREPVGRVIGQRMKKGKRASSNKRERRVAADIDPLDRIHLHGDIQAHDIRRDESDRVADCDGSQPVASTQFSSALPSAAK